MADPTPFPHKRRAQPLPPVEPDAERRARQLAYFRELAELNMKAARIAAAEIDAAHASGEPSATASPTLDLARATRAVTLVVAHENRIADGERARAPRVPFTDTRRDALRKPLHDAVAAAPQHERAKLRRQLDEAIEDTLAADPDAELPLIDHLFAVTDEFGIALDPAKLSDEILGISPIRHPRHQDPNATPPPDH